MRTQSYVRSTVWKGLAGKDIPSDSVARILKNIINFPLVCNVLGTLQTILFYKGFREFRVSFENETPILL